jgi:hypothetical protein
MICSSPPRVASTVLHLASGGDEGTSFHYLPASRSVAAPPGPVALLASQLKRLGVPAYEGTVWTTDAPYRETRQQLDQYGEEGGLAVEMHAASLFALAQVRQAQIAVVAHVSNATDHEGEQIAFRSFFDLPASAITSHASQVLGRVFTIAPMGSGKFDSILPKFCVQFVGIIGIVPDQISRCLGNNHLDKGGSSQFHFMRSRAFDKYRDG